MTTEKGRREPPGTADEEKKYGVIAVWVESLKAAQVMELSDPRPPVQTGLTS